MSQSLTIIIVEKTGVLKTLTVKEYKEETLFKKCGFKKQDGFVKQCEWNNIKFEGNKYVISVYAKDDGKANGENKYDFPPPIDKKLFFGSCAIVASIKNNDGSQTLTNLSLPLWEKIYEKLFGGFESLAVTADEDDDEEDELANIPKEKKTKQGYLKDGFVVESGDDGSESYNSDDSENEDSNDYDSSSKTSYENDEDIIIEDIGSELSEESYDYSDSEK